MSTTGSTKFKGYNSPEYQIIREVFASIPMMDVYVANVVEEYIYATVIKYYPSSSLLMYEEYRTRFKEKDGLYRSWYPGTNIIWVECFYASDQLNGLHRTWDKKRRTIKEESTYVSGRKHGISTHWGTDGIKSTHTYVSGQLHGVSTEWWVNCKKTECTFRYGRLTGMYTEWNKDGTILTQRMYT